MTIHEYPKWKKTYLDRTFSSKPGGLQQLHHVLHLYEDVRPVTLHNHIRQRWQEVIPAYFLS